MININTTGIILASVAFVATLFLWYLYEEKINKNKLSNLDKRLNVSDDETAENIEDKKEKKGFFDRIQDNLHEAEMKMNIWIFFIVIVVVTLMLYLLTLSVFKKPLVALSPLPFTVYLLPKLIIDAKKNKVMNKFDEELVIVLRRMSSVLQSGSILQALEEVKDLKNISRKMRKMLNEVHHRFRYGDSIEKAFYKAAENINSENLNIAVVSIDLNKELGANLSESLNEISMRIQKKQLTSKEAKSLLSQTVMIGNILSAAPFLILGFIAYSNPTYFDTYLSSLNNQIIFVGMILFMFIGIFIIQKGSQQKMR